MPGSLESPRHDQPVADEAPDAPAAESRQSAEVLPGSCVRLESGAWLIATPPGAPVSIQFQEPGGAVWAWQEFSPPTTAIRGNGFFVSRQPDGRVFVEAPGWSFRYRINGGAESLAPDSPGPAPASRAESAEEVERLLEPRLDRTREGAERLETIRSRLEADVRGELAPFLPGSAADALRVETRPESGGVRWAVLVNPGRSVGTGSGADPRTAVFQRILADESLFESDAAPEWLVSRPGNDSGLSFPSALRRAIEEARGDYEREVREVLLASLRQRAAQAKQTFEAALFAAYAAEPAAPDRPALIGAATQAVGEPPEVETHPAEAMAAYARGIVELARVEAYLREYQELSAAAEAEAENARGAERNYEREYRDRYSFFSRRIWDVRGNANAFRRLLDDRRATTAAVVGKQREIAALRGEPLPASAKHARLRALYGDLTRLQSSHVRRAVTGTRAEAADLRLWQASIPSDRDVVVGCVGLLPIPGASLAAGVVWDGIEVANGNLTTEELLANAALEAATSLLPAGVGTVAGTGARVAVRAAGTRLVRQATTQAARRFTATGAKRFAPVAASLAKHSAESTVRTGAQQAIAHTGVSDRYQKLSLDGAARQIVGDAAGGSLGDGAGRIAGTGVRRAMRPSDAASAGRQRLQKAAAELGGGAAGRLASEGTEEAVDGVLNPEQREPGPV